MGYPIDEKLVIGISTTALFDLDHEAKVFSEQGLDAFIAYQKAHKDKTLGKGVAFDFIKRLLDLNTLFADEQPVEVVVLSRNHPEASVRVRKSIKDHGLSITRMMFRSGADPYRYMKPLNCKLYLSTNEDEVGRAIDEGFPAGYVLPSPAKPDRDGDEGLRIAFDFDGVLVDDEAERVYADKGLPLFHHHEHTNAANALRSGPLMPLLKSISQLQELERSRKSNSGDTFIRVSIVTARDAPADQRIMTTLEEFGIQVDDLFLLGGIQKAGILDVLDPHIFFDDQRAHLEPSAHKMPCVHVPFGVRNTRVVPVSRKLSPRPSKLK